MPIPDQTRNALIIFIKYPNKGKVKTRLAKSLGDEFALELYKIFVEKLINDIKTCPGIDVYIFFTDCDSKTDMINWLGDKFNYVQQTGKNLGEKMYNAFETVLGENHGKTIIIGTDIPDINCDIINNAFEKLNDNDIVITETNDGGYCLLGMRNLHKELFNNIEWSTPDVFNTTIERCKGLNLSVCRLPEFTDIDSETDLLSWIKNGWKSEFKSNIEIKYNTVKNQINTED